MALPSNNQRSATLIVGREREQELLSGLLADALGGHGSLALIGGAAGIGKTTLVRACAAEAAARGFQVLTGACYDGGTNPPYGPWVELTASAARRDALPARPWNRETLAQAGNPDVVVAELRAYLETLGERGPLVLVLEDLHWADPESLGFLRVFARQLSQHAMLVIATYRDDELRRNQPLDQHLPQFVRESNARRISLHPLDEPAIQTLVTRTYDLPAADLARLVAHLGGRSQGVPLYLREMLRSLEEEQRLRRVSDGWSLSDIEHLPVPELVRQVIEGRLARLGGDVRRVLEVAAVIGQEVPLLLWRQVSDAGDDRFDEAIERAIDAHVLEETPSGQHLRFTHALVRDALYEGMSLPQRQRRHRTVAEALADDAQVEPEIVAHHFRQALDPRAAEWFVRAGSRVEQVAWLTAASQFEMALDMLGGNADPAQRGWLLIRRARLLRVAEPRTALALFETAAALAEDAGDAVLRAYVLFLRGQVRSLANEMPAGVADIEASVDEFGRLSPADIVRVEAIERQGVFLSRIEMEGHLAGVLAAAGRVDEALTRTAEMIARAEGNPGRAWWGRAIALALAGRVEEAREAYAMARDAARRAADLSGVVLLYLYQLWNVELPYGADNLAERTRIVREAEATWRQVGGDLGNVSPRTAWLPILLIEGEWEEARALALDGFRPNDASSERDLTSATVLAQLAWAQGDVALAWELIHKLLPSGPQTIDMDLAHALVLIRIAVGLCLDYDDLPAARAWLGAHDRWLAWSGADLGRADGRNAWASYALAAGDLPAARRHVEEALALASDPRQPLALLAARRLAGAIESHAGKIVEARRHLDAALALADACAAPYERALTLLTVAELDLRSTVMHEAEAALDEARRTFTRLGAMPALARVDALIARLSDQATIMQRVAPAGLSPREVEVLRLIASGRNNREIAETLFLSVRTVERHITNLYAKIGAERRADAVDFARRHALI